MGERDQAAQQHQPHISSLVVRPSISDGGNGGNSSRGDGGRATGASDYEPGEVRRDPLSHTRSDRYKDDPGNGNRAASGSPVRRVGGNHRYGPDHDHSSGPARAREFGGRREQASRFRGRDSSPVYGRGRPGGRSFDRGLDGPGYGRAPLSDDGVGRNNNPNVRPREGDWFCPDPMCRNLNFARREYCNNCKRHRYAPAASPPRRGYQAAPPPPLLPPRRYPGPPMDLSPRRNLNGYRSPPRRDWGRDAPRDFSPGSRIPPPRHHDLLLRDRERLDYLDDGFRGRSRLDRMGPVVEWGHGERGRDRHVVGDRKGIYDRRLLAQSPPLPPPAAGGRLPPPREGRWGRDGRERSRSPLVRGGGGGMPRRDEYDERGVDERRGGMGRGRVGGGGGY